MTSPEETKPDRSQAILGQLKRVVPVAVKRPVQRALPVGKLQLDYLVERGLEEHPNNQKMVVFTKD
jgi:hypothetical protein